MKIKRRSFIKLAPAAVALPLASKLIKPSNPTPKTTKSTLKLQLELIKNKYGS